MTEARCSFCGDPQSKAVIMIRSPKYFSKRANICDDCVSICVQVLLDEGVFHLPDYSLCTGECR